MTAAEALDLLRLAIWTVGIASAPALVAAMLTGTVIAVLQALTQIQEVTLTFVPKIIVILLVLVVSGAWIGSSLKLFAETCYAQISPPVR